MAVYRFTYGSVVGPLNLHKVLQIVDFLRLLKFKLVAYLNFRGFMQYDSYLLLSLNGNSKSCKRSNQSCSSSIFLLAFTKPLFSPII